MTDAEAMDLMLRIAATTLHYGSCRIISGGDCDCIAYDDVESLIEHLVSR